VPAPSPATPWPPLQTGGTSEREKQRKKAMPHAARLVQLQRRHDATKRKNFSKNFKGHVRS
jgi:hypothetical protein